ncbi:B12-binding domain-containing radical SAM protein [Candidatus Omnitrophota bacterium]
MANLKIVLVSPPFSYGKVNILGPKSPRLGLAQLAACLREQGYGNIRIIDATAMDYGEREVVEAILNEEPAFVGFTATTTEYPIVLKIAEKLKKERSSVCCVIGGPHITVMPETFRGDVFDYAVIGEGEKTILELMDYVFHAKGDVSRIKGLAFTRNAKLISTDQREFLQDLDTLPMPAHDLLPVDHYRPPAMSDRGRLFTCMITSRGCPFQCSFCSSSRIFGRRIRSRSVEKVIEEIDYLQDRFGISHIYFQDDEFIVNRKRLLAFCDAMKKRKRNCIWDCLGRVSDIDEEVARAMAEAGCIGIIFGAEFGYQEGLDRVGKRITLDMTRKAIRVTKAVGISARASFMMGFPWEGEKEIRKTIDFAMDIKADILALQIFIPYPGTEIYQQMLDENLIVNREWSDYIQHSISGTRPIIRTRHISDTDLKRLNNAAFRRMLTSPFYVFRVLSQIKSFRQFYRIAVGGASVLLMSAKDPVNAKQTKESDV